MSVACIIAACAAAARQRSEPTKQPSQEIIPKKEVYYKVIFKKAFYFKSFVQLVPEKGNFIGFAEEQENFNRSFRLAKISVPSKTLGVQQIFTIPARVCSKGINNYIKEHFEDFTNDFIWDPFEKEAIKMYLNDVKTLYNILPDKKLINYTTEFFWDIDSSFDDKE